MRNRTRGLLRAATHGARWGRPWLSVLAIAAIVAYAMTVAVGSAASAGDASTTSDATLAAGATLVSGVPGWSAASSAGVSSPATAGACTRLLYVGLDSWVRAEPNLTACPASLP